MFKMNATESKESFTEVCDISTKILGGGCTLLGDHQALYSPQNNARNTYVLCNVEADFTIT